MCRSCFTMFLIVGILVCFTFSNGGDVDVVNEIRVEEEKHHNATLAKYLIASLGGKLHSIFPSVTAYESVEIEKILSDVFPIGDPSRLMPYNTEKLESNLCRTHKERGAKILKYVRKRWPTHLITQIAMRVCLQSFGEKNDKYCSDGVLRNAYISNASVINSHINDLNVARNKFIDNMMAIMYGNHSIHKLAAYCCSFWTYKSQSLSSITERQTKIFFTDYLESYTGKAIKYLCVYHSEGSKACANLVIPSPPTNVPRFSSILSASIETIAKLTLISP